MAGGVFVKGDNNRNSLKYEMGNIQNYKGVSKKKIRVQYKPITFNVKTTNKTSNYNMKLRNFISVGCT